MADVRDSAPIWARSEPGARKPRFTRAQIIRVGLAIADGEGIDAVSMRRIATELGAGTMTVYHYVPSKRDLVALMTDEVMAELLLPARELTGDWRHVLTALARRTRAVFRSHPWAITGMDEQGRMSPHAMRHFEQSLAAVAGTGLDARTRVEIVGMVDDFVSGFVLKSDIEPGAEAVQSAPDALGEYLRSELSGGEYPHIQELVGDREPMAALRE
ncbi:hypothetical protein VT50_0232020, partial [Streptomyces antioxidans]